MNELLNIERYEKLKKKKTKTKKNKQMH